MTMFRKITPDSFIADQMISILNKQTKQGCVVTVWYKIVLFFFHDKTGHQKIGVSMSG